MMRDEQKYTAPVFKKDLKEQLNTLSPNGLFYYHFQEPVDHYWGLFLCKVAFYNINEELIYYKPEQFAQCGLNENCFWECIFYSASGNMVFFAERHSTKSLHWVIIHLLDRKVFKLDYSNEKEARLITDRFAKSGFADEEALEFVANKFKPITDNKVVFELRSTLWRPLI